MEIISKEEALSKGLKWFFTGQPCKHGHISERRTGPGNACRQCEIMRQERAKEFADRRRQTRKSAAPPPRPKRWEERYPWLIKARPVVDPDAPLRVVPREEARMYGFDYYYTGQPCKHGHLSQRSTQYSTCMTCQDIRHRKSLLTYGILYLHGSKKMLEYQMKRVRAMPDWADSIRIQSVYQQVMLLEHQEKLKQIREEGYDDFAEFAEDYIGTYTNSMSYTDNSFAVDHIVPIGHDLVSGLHVHWNLRAVTSSENFYKGKRFDQEGASQEYFEWLKERGL